MDLGHTMRNRFKFTQINPFDVNRLNNENKDVQTVSPDLQEESAAPHSQESLKSNKPSGNRNLEEPKIRTLGDAFSTWLDAEYATSFQAKDSKEKKLKNEIEVYLLELDGIEPSGDNYARKLDTQQLSTLESYITKLNDKENYPNLELKIEYKEDNLCDIYLFNKGEYVYSVDDLDTKMIKSIINNTKSKYVDDYCAVLKQNLIDANGYDDSYSEKIIEFIRQKINIDDAANLEDLLTDIDNISNILTGKTDLKEYRFNHTIHCEDIYKIFQDAALYQNSKGASIQDEFFMYMLESSFNFEIPEDRTAIINKLFMRLNNEIGRENKFRNDSYNQHTNDFRVYMTEMSKLDKNGDDSWLDEFFSVVNEFSEQINKTSGYQNAVSVDTEALYGDKEELTPSDITTMLNDMLFSNDEGVVKLRATLYDAFKRFNIDNYYDEAEIITNIIKMLNNKAGVENTKPIKLTKEVFEKLNDGTLFEVLEKYIKSDELREEYYFGIDDELDLYGEARKSGACWAIAALTSLSNTEIGKQMIKDAMTFNDDGSVTVTFKGALDGNGNPRSYTITREEMEAAKNNSDGVSYGDNTMFVLLLATEKLRKDLGIRVIAKQSSLSPDDPGYGIYCGWGETMVEWFTGKAELELLDDITRKLYDNCSDDMKAYLDYIERVEGKSSYSYLKELLGIEQNLSKSEMFYALKDGLISGDVMLHLSTVGVASMPIYPDGEMQNFGGSHAWGVKNITEETVTFWDLYRQTEYTVSIDDLLNSGFFISYTVLNDEYEFYTLYDLLKERFYKLEEEVVNSNTQYDKTITDSDLYSYRISIGSSEVISKKTLKYKIESLLISICKNIPNYTDYCALMNAYDDVLSSNLSNAMDLIAQLIDENMPHKYIIEKLQESLNAENIINQFLSLLPDGES